MNTKIDKRNTATSSDGLNPFRMQIWGKSKSMADQHLNGISMTLLIIFLLGGVITAIILDTSGMRDWVILAIVMPLMLIGFILFFSIQVARQWEKAVVLRMGRIRGLKGPGLFWIIPILDTITTWIDQRVMVTPFSAEKTLTRDTVPVNVDAVGAILAGLGC